MSNPYIKSENSDQEHQRFGMPYARNNDIKSHADAVYDLKKEFISLVQNQQDEKKIVDIMKKMRSLYGSAIYYDSLYKKNLIDKYVSTKPTECELINLSINSGLLHLIHEHIKQCDKIAYNFKNKLVSEEKQFDENVINEMLNKERSENKIKPVIKKVSPTTETLSIKNFNTESESESKINTSDFGKRRRLSSSPVTDINTSEFIDKITSSDAARLVSDYAPSTEKSENSPILVYYWADWCRHSEKFNPTWEKFKNIFKSQKNVINEKLQIHDLNVGRDEELNSLAQKSGIVGYPAIVLFQNGNRYLLDNLSNLNTNDIVKFIKDANVHSTQPK